MKHKKVEHQTGDHRSGIEALGITCDGVTVFGVTVEKCNRPASHEFWNNSHECYWWCEFHYQLEMHQSYPEQFPDPGDEESFYGRSDRH